MRKLKSNLGCPINHHKTITIHMHVCLPTACSATKQAYNVLIPWLSVHPLTHPWAGTLMHPRCLMQHLHEMLWNILTHVLQLKHRPQARTPLSIPSSPSSWHAHTPKMSHAAHARDATKWARWVLVLWLLTYTLQLEHRPSSIPQLSHTQDTSCSTCMRCYEMSALSAHLWLLMHTQRLKHRPQVCTPSSIPWLSVELECLHTQDASCSMCNEMLWNEHLECLFHGSSHTHYSSNTGPCPSPSSPSSWHAHVPKMPHTAHATRHYEMSTLSACFVAPRGSFCIPCWCKQHVQWCLFACMVGHAYKKTSFLLTGHLFLFVSVCCLFVFSGYDSCSLCVHVQLLTCNVVFFCAHLCPIYIITL